MPYAEQLTAINETYYANLRRAQKFPVTTKKGHVGVRRARLIARARRERSAALAGLVSPAYLR